MTRGIKATKYANYIHYIQRFRINQFSQLSFVYRPALKERQEELIELIKQKSSNLLESDFAKKMHIAKEFYRVEMSPPKYDEMKQLREDIALVEEFIKKGCFKYITIRQAWLIFLICLEIGLWFFLGETIGKFHIVGYKV